MRKKLSWIIVAFFSLLAIGITGASSLVIRGQQPSNLETDAIAQLRSLYFERDYEGASIAGKKLVSSFPSSLPLRAWFVLNLAANGDSGDAVRLAFRMKTSHPKSPWSWFAVAAALNYESTRSNEALSASEKALSQMPSHPDYLWLRALTLRLAGRYDEAVAFVEKHRGNVANTSKLLVVRATALSALTYRTPTEQKTHAAIDAFKDLISLYPNDVEAHYQLGNYLLNLRRPTESYPYLKRALELSPNATRIHTSYWRAIKGLSKTASEKRLEIESDIDSLLLRRPEYPDALLFVSLEYDSLKLESKRSAIEERILRDYSSSRQAEWVLVLRYRRFRDKFGAAGPRNSQDRQLYRRMLWSFINRTHHFQDELVGDAYRNLLHSTDKDDLTMSNPTLLSIVKGLIKHERRNVRTAYGESAVALADRGAYLDYAESIAREGIKEAKTRMDEERSSLPTAGDYQTMLDRLTAIMRDALGWVIFKAGRLPEAESELLKARELDPNSITNLLHLGKFYEAKGNLASAEEFYVKGAMLQTPRENPNLVALKNLYQRRFGSLQGYDSYFAKIGDFDREKRRDAVLKSRSAEPKPLEPFHLSMINGGSFSSENIRGKIAVINFWGVWCGWCIQEMPEFQKLTDKYKGDSGVAILTIDNDPNADDVRLWLQQKGYNFPVLLDDGYVNRIGLSGFPTTWFVDQAGRIAFVKSGWSEKLVEEFSWRIDALKSGPSSAAPSAQVYDRLRPPKSEFRLEVNASIEPQPVSLNREAHLLIQFNIPSGYHINAHKPNEDYLIPTNLTLMPQEGIKWGETRYPEATNITRRFSSKPLAVYQREVVIKTPLVLTAASSSEVMIRASLRVQACNEESCLPPTTIPISTQLKLRVGN